MNDWNLKEWLKNTILQKSEWLSDRTEKVLIGVIVNVVLLLLSSITIGSMISSNNENIHIVNTALKTQNTNEFNYAIKTKQGNIVHNGKFELHDSFKFDEMTQSFGAIKRIEEHYVMKTREVAYECGTSKNPQTCYRTEVYWEWDKVGEEVKISSSIKFEDNLYDINKFYLNNYWRGIDTKSVIDGYNKQYYEPKNNVRYSYETIPQEFTGTILIKTNDENFTSIGGGHIEISSLSLNAYVEDVQNSNTFIYIFGTIFTIILLGGINWFLFMYIFEVY